MGEPEKRNKVKATVDLLVHITAGQLRPQVPGYSMFYQLVMKDLSFFSP